MLTSISRFYAGLRVFASISLNPLFPWLFETIKTRSLGRGGSAVVHRRELPRIDYLCVRLQPSGGPYINRTRWRLAGGVAVVRVTSRPALPLSRPPDGVLLSWLPEGRYQHVHGSIRGRFARQTEGGYPRPGDGFFWQWRLSVLEAAAACAGDGADRTRGRWKP